MAVDTPPLEISRNLTRLTTMTPVAVIILNWNGAKLLRQFLPSVICHTPARLGTVIVADNGSTDESLTVLREEFPEVEVMALDQNYGFSEGYNRAISAVDNPYVVLLNSDVAAEDDWLTPLWEYMEHHPDTGACQPKLLSYNHPEQFEYAGACGGLLDRNGYPYCRGRIFDTCETDNGQYDTPMDVDWATGAALMVRRELYLELGGLDPMFFAHMEEIDLCWRMRLAGYKIAAVPGGKLYHLGGGSLPPSDPRKTYLNFRNNLLMMHKNLAPAIRRKALFRRRLLDGIAWLRAVLLMQWGNAGAILRAHNDYRRMSREAKLSHVAPGSESQAMLAGRRNILTAYYLAGRRRYSDLK